MEKENTNNPTEEEIKNTNGLAKEEIKNPVKKNYKIINVVLSGILIIIVSVLIAVGWVSATTEAKLGAVMKEKGYAYNTLDCRGLLNTTCTATDVIGNDGISAKSVTLENVQDLAKIGKKDFSNINLLITVVDLKHNGERIFWNSKIITPLKVKNKKHFLKKLKTYLDVPSQIKLHLKVNKQKKVFNVKYGVSFIVRDFHINIKSTMLKPNVDTNFKNVVIKNISLDVNFSNDALDKLLYAMYEDSVMGKKNTAVNNVLAINKQLGIKSDKILNFNDFKKALYNASKKEMNKDKKIDSTKKPDFLDDINSLILKSIKDGSLSMRIKIENKKSLNVQDITPYLMNALRTKNAHDLDNFLKINVK